MAVAPLQDLWLDDIREPEFKYPLDHPMLWVRTSDAAIDALQEGNIRWASLDHDLGISRERDRNGHTGYTVVLWMAANNIWPQEGVIVHSWNVVGAQNMCATIDRYGPWRALRRPAYAI